ncbi:DNA-binding protein [Massilia soli]|uniref:DNA-binding protein n=1 Tax=Massilia soli TaxID=2792854 RepID=A0ABS7SKC8_9BURK|nr:DNA-binding protein [Massilia soli]MBZ2206270.1 DNA-binding protein [Massilia soli]
MARQEVTFDEVSAAAIGLQDDGEQVTIDTVRERLGSGSPHAIHKHLASWRESQAKPAAPIKADIPEALAAALGQWAQQFAEDAGAATRDALAAADSDIEVLRKSGEALEAEREELAAEVDTLTSERDQSMAMASERSDEIERLTIELRDARRLATDALVGKAKDQLAIDGKDAQLAILREQVERNVAALAAESDARLAAEMELVGAVTARDNFAAEITTLRSQFDAAKAERTALREQVRRAKPA